MKVTYITLDGHESTAYLDAEPDDDGYAEGTSKYTDEDVLVRLVGGVFREVEARE